MRKVLTNARRHRRLRWVTALAAVGAMTASMGVVLLGAATAQVNADEPCVPQDAWTEITGWVAASPGAGWYEVDRRVIPGTDPVPEVVEYEFRLLIKAAVPQVTDEIGVQHYAWNPTKDDDPDTPPPFPDPRWQEDERKWDAKHPDPIEEAYRTGGGQSWFYWTGQTVVITPGSPAEYEYRWALTSPGEGWVATGNSRVVQASVPGTPAVTEYKFAFDHPAVTCGDTPPLPPVTDVCLNIDGVQEEVPPGYTLDDYGDCAEIAGEDEVVPEPKPDKTPADGADSEPTVAGVQAVAPSAAAPTAVAAGLVGDTGLTTGQLLGQSLAGLGLVILLAAGWLGVPRRTLGAHEN